MDRKQSVLFLCTGNSARSQMAEAFLKKYASERFEVHSAGLDPSVINPFTLKVMEDIEFNMSGHEAKSVREYLGKDQFTYVITVCSSAEERCPTSFLGELHRLHWPFEDPAVFEGSDEEKIEVFQKVRDQISKKILAWLKDLAAA